MKKEAMAELFRKAKEAGLAAGGACVPVGMVVGEADGLSDRFKPGAQLEYVADGSCGFAWVNVKPANSPFANWLKKAAGGEGGRLEGFGIHKSYYGGTDIWVSMFNQSMQKKEACAAAMAKVLYEAGIRAYAMSRMD